MADLRDALAILSVVVLHDHAGIHVKVLPVAGEVEPSREVRQEVAHVVPPLLVAVVEERPQQQVGVLLGEVGRSHHALRLEPQHDPHAGVLRRVTHVFQSFRVDARVRHPVARPAPPVARVGVVALRAVAVPARVDPEVFVGESLRLQRVDAADHLGGGEPAPQLVGEKPLADAWARRDMREVFAQEAAELVRAVLALRVVHHEDAARAQFLARLQVEPRARDSRLHAHALRAVRELRAPAARPADGDDRALSALRHLEERRLAIRRTRAAVADLEDVALAAPRVEGARDRRELASGRRVVRRIVDSRDASVHRDHRALARQGDVAGELLRLRRQEHEEVAVTDLAQDGAFLRRRVLEPQHPLNGVELRIGDALHRHLQVRVHLQGLASRHGPVAVLERKSRPRHLARVGKPYSDCRNGSGEECDMCIHGAKYTEKDSAASMGNPHLFCTLQFR